MLFWNKVVPMAQVFSPRANIKARVLIFGTVESLLKARKKSLNGFDNRVIDVRLCLAFCQQLPLWHE